MELLKITVTLQGIADILFDRFWDHSGEDRPPERKLYLNAQNDLCLPGENIHSFLFRDMPPVGVVRFVEKKKAKDYIAIGQAHVSIQPTLIPFATGDGTPIHFDGFGPDRAMYVNDWSAGLTKQSGGKVVKQEVKPRPVLRLPWFLPFELHLFQQEKVTADKLFTWFQTGGLTTALGSYRPRYGRFLVTRWETT